MNCRFAFIPILFVGVLLPASVIGGPVTLDFEELRREDALTTFRLGPRYEKAGMVLEATHFSPIANPPTFAVPGTESPSFAGSTAIYHHRSLGGITLTQLDGGAFDLLSIDLIQLPGFDSSGNPRDLGPFSVTFFGARIDGSMIENTYTSTKFFTLETFEFVGFTDLVSVDWFQGAGGAGSLTHQFDNIVVTPVPEPSTIALLALGVAGAGLVARRRRS